MSQWKTHHFLNNSVQHWPIMIIFGSQHYEATRRNLAHLILILLLYYLVKWRSQFGHIQQRIRTGEHTRRLKKFLRLQNHWKLFTYLTLVMFVLKSYSANWNNASTASEPLWVTRFWTCYLQVTSTSTACIRAGGSILSTHSNKNDAM